MTIIGFQVTTEFWGILCINRRLFNNTVQLQMLAYLVSNCIEGRIGEIELIRIGDEATVVYFKVPQRHSAVGTEEIYGKNISRYRRTQGQDSNLGPTENQARVY